MKALKILQLLLATAICLMPQQKPLEELFSRMPEAVSTWSKPSTFQTYGPDTLYDYINGGAELYLSYGFKRLLSCQYSGNNLPDITVDLFDMGTSYQAYGIFSHSRESIDDTIGQGCEYGGGLLVFWKGQFYVSILVFPETDLARESIFKIARKLADSIPNDGPLPPVLNMLPEKHLVHESIRYFNHHIWLNSYYFISNENILHIDKQTEAVMAQYSGQSGKYVLLLVVYPDSEKARKAQADFRKHYLKEASAPIKIAGDNSWAGCKRVQNRLWLVLNAGSKKIISDVFSEIQVD